jgi:hypothetical protein
MDPQVCSCGAHAVITDIIHCLSFRTYSASYSVVADSLEAAAREVKGRARARTSFIGYTCLWRTCIRERRPS